MDETNDNTQDQKPKRSRTIAVILVLGISFCFCMQIAAKRLAPSEVKPIIHEGIKYIVIHFPDLISEVKQNGGYIEARDAKTDKKLWGLMVYKIEYNRKLESDVQDVFITSLRVDKKANRLIIENELNYTYHVDLKTKKVLHVIRHKQRLSNR